MVIGCEIGIINNYCIHTHTHTHTYNIVAIIGGFSTLYGSSKTLNAVAQSSNSHDIWYNTL